jgi:hypothetical protein
VPLNISNNDTINYLDYHSSPLNISNNQLLLRFESFNIRSDLQSQKGPISFERTGISNDNFGYIILEENYFSLYPGQINSIYFKPIITHTSDDDRYQLDLNSQLERLEPNQFKIGIVPRSRATEFKDMVTYNCKYKILPVLFLMMHLIFRYRFNI